MASKPKTAAEILASAVRAPAPKRRKPAQRNPIFSSDQFSVFSVSEASSTTASSVDKDNEISCANLNGSNSSFKFASVTTPELYKESGSIDVERSTGGYEEDYEADMSTLPENISSSFRHQTKRISRFERIDEALDVLKAGHLSPFDLILAILDVSNEKYGGYQNEFYKKDNKKLDEFLDLVLSNETGNRKLQKWMEPHALDLVYKKVKEEMDNVQCAERLPGTEAITPTFIEDFGRSDSERAPFLTRILLTLAASETAAAKGKK